MGVWIWGHHRSEECWAGGTPGAVLTVLKGTAMMIMRADDDDHTIDGDGDDGRTAVHRVSTPRSDFKATPSTTLHHIMLVLPVAILALLSFTMPCTCPPIIAYNSASGTSNEPMQVPCNSTKVRQATLASHPNTPSRSKTSIAGS